MGQEAAVVSNDMENCSENLYMSQINNCDKLNWCDFFVIIELAKLHKKVIIVKTWCYSWLLCLFLPLRCQIF